MPPLAARRSRGSGGGARQPPPAACPPLRGPPAALRRRRWRRQRAGCGAPWPGGGRRQRAGRGAGDAGCPGCAARSLAHAHSPGRGGAHPLLRDVSAQRKEGAALTLCLPRSPGCRHRGPCSGTAGIAAPRGRARLRGEPGCGVCPPRPRGVSGDKVPPPRPSPPLPSSRLLLAAVFCSAGVRRACGGQSRNAGQLSVGFLRCFLGCFSAPRFCGLERLVFGIPLRVVECLGHGCWQWQQPTYLAIDTTYKNTF